MGKNINLTLPDGQTINVYVSNDAETVAETAQKLTQQYGFYFDPVTLASAREEARTGGPSASQQLVQSALGTPERVQEDINSWYQGYTQSWIDKHNSVGNIFNSEGINVSPSATERREELGLSQPENENNKGLVLLGALALFFMGK